jgi:LmbE family N-acetylglucosaminyl deacetylase
MLLMMKNIKKIVIAAIRKYQPEIVITSAYHDELTDHGKASELVNDACFFLTGWVKPK